MSRQVIWTKAVLEAFIAEANLTPEETKIMRTRAAGWSRVKQSVEFNMSLATIDRTVLRLKKKIRRGSKVFLNITSEKIVSPRDLER